MTRQAIIKVLAYGSDIAFRLAFWWAVAAMAARRSLFGEADPASQPERR